MLGFVEGEKPDNLEKTPQIMRETQQPLFKSDAESRNQTQAHRGERQAYTAAPPLIPLNLKRKLCFFKVKTTPPSKNRGGVQGVRTPLDQLCAPILNR